MLSSDVRRVFQREVAELGRREAGGRYRLEARQVFERMRFPGGEVEVVGELQAVRSRVLELASWPTDVDTATATEEEDLPRRVFGLDGGSTRPMAFRNGVTACANQALLVSEQGVRLDGLPLEAYRTVAWVTHSQDERDKPGAALRRDGLVARWDVQLTKFYVPRNVEEVVKGMADAASESVHLIHMAQELDLGPRDVVFSDGRLYPLNLYYYLISSEGRNYHWDIDLTAREEWLEVLQGPLSAVCALRGRGVLHFGINKNPASRPLLAFGVPENQRRWHNDRQFISALFESIPHTDLGYTNWFVQARYPSRQVGGDRAEAVDLFEELRLLALERPARDYHVAFFFIYDPRVNAALRVEAPRALLEAQDPERLRLIALSQVARGAGGVPNAIRIADAQARITHQEREALLQASGLMPDWVYDHSRDASAWRG